MPQVGQRLQNELPKRPAQRLLAAPQMVVLPPVRQRLAEAAQLRAVRGEPRDELMPVHLQVPQASQLLACLLALEPVPSEPPWEPRARRSERVSRALLPELQASLLARQERRAWRRQEFPVEPAGEPPGRPASFAQPSLRILSLPSPLWRPLRLALRLRQLPEFSFAPCPRRPREWSSSASFSR